MLQDFQYPFDEQECIGRIGLPYKNNYTVALRTSDTPISLIGPTLLSTFEIQNLSAVTNITSKGSDFVFTIKLRRIWTSIFITTFLQTFVLWFLVYLTLFIDVKDFNNRFMGAITGFLVFASLLSSIIASLPKSSSMKLADIWLLFYMINIILVIIIHIFIEYQQRRGMDTKVSSEKFQYPKDKPISSGLRTNNIAKLMLPIIITIFLIAYGVSSFKRTAK